MRRTIVLSAILLLHAATLCGEELTGKQIIDRVNDLINQETCYAQAKMTIITTSGQERTFEYESWTKDRGEKNLIRYSAPRRVRGQAILMLNFADDIWMFFPRTQRVRKLATHAKKQRMEGSDFSYEDMGSGDTFVKDFVPERLDDEKMEGADCYTVELLRKKGSDSAYSRLIMWIIKENFVPIVIDYYDEDDPNRLLKHLVQSDIRPIDGVPTAMKMVMFDRQDNTHTNMELINVKYNIPLEDETFTERGLKK